jgi:glycosyltransferase involved in cell wall biosynthesis
VNSPVLRHLERRILRSPEGRILSISHHTGRALSQIAGRPMAGVLRLPVADHFQPRPDRVQPWRLGFSGRYRDPRKRIDLLLEAVALLARGGHPVCLELTGEPDPSFLLPRLAALGIADRVCCHTRLDPSGLAAVLQGLDLFVIPSHQEGLCIAAVEAMACAVPVLSTRCGGPEDFVIPGQTGAFTQAEPAAMAAAIAAICGHRPRREALARGAAAWAREQAGEPSAHSVLGLHWRQLYPSASPL